MCVCVVVSTGFCIVLHYKMSSTEEQREPKAVGTTVDEAAKDTNMTEAAPPVETEHAPSTTIEKPAEADVPRDTEGQENGDDKMATDAQQEEKKEQREAEGSTPMVEEKGAEAKAETGEVKENDKKRDHEADDNAEEQQAKKQKQEDDVKKEPEVPNTETANATTEGVTDKEQDKTAATKDKEGENAKEEAVKPPLPTRQYLEATGEYHLNKP